MKCKKNQSQQTNIQLTRKEYVEYTNHVNKLGENIFSILLEGLRLKPNHLKATLCAKEQGMSCHYYPTFPQSVRTIGTRKHTGHVFLTFILQKSFCNRSYKITGL